MGDAPALCAGKQVLILTHNHQLDFDLCRTLLTAGDCAGIGLIGSDTKAERFRQRLEHRGFSGEQIATIRCPVGRSDIPGKRPMEVAVSISAELLSLTASADQPATRRGLPWKELKGLIQNTDTDQQSEPSQKRSPNES